MISTKSERKPLTSTIWLTDQITRKFKNRSLQNFQTWQFTSLSLRKQQRSGLNGTVKSLNCYFTWEEKPSRALLFFVDSPSLYPKRFVVSFFTWSADKNGGSVARGNTASSFCGILFPIYLQRRISVNICFQILFAIIYFDFWAKFFLLGNAEFTKRPLLRE